MTDNIFDLPTGISDSDPRWQWGYKDGNAFPRPPSNPDPIYVSGWCHGHNEALQCSREDSERAYRRATGAILEEWMPRTYSPHDLYHLMRHHGLSSLRPVSEAPRDGTYVVCVELALPDPGVEGVLARVPPNGITNEFLQADLLAGRQDEDGLREDTLLGWLQVPLEWPVMGSPEYKGRVR